MSRSLWARCGYVISIAALLFLIIGYFHSAAYSNKAAATGSPAAIDVEAVAAVQQPMPKEVESLGSLQAVNKATISSEVDGRIDNIFFKSGAQVAKGMPIVQLDNQKEQADYDKAVSQLKLDRLKYARQKAAGDAISAQDLNNQQALVQQDQTDVQSKAAALAQKQIKAPFSGVLGDFKVNVGDFIKSGVAIISLVNSEQLRAVYNLSENTVPQLKTGQLATISLDTYPKKVFYGTVSYISPTVDKVARTVTVQALVKNSEGLLRPGMFIHVTQQIDVQQNALVIPEQALMVDVKGPYVYKIANAKAARVDVKVGTRKSGVAQITQGLVVGDRVVVAGQQKLDIGTPVHVVQTLPAVLQTMQKAADAANPHSDSNNTAASSAATGSGAASSKAAGGAGSKAAPGAGSETTTAPVPAKSLEVPEPEPAQTPASNKPPATSSR